jgi:hypothetical protein
MGWYYLFELFAGANSPNQPCKHHAEKIGLNALGLV